jgi:VRR-NUC domain
VARPAPPLRAIEGEAVNNSEREEAKALEAAGWTIVHSGIPDFICLRRNADGSVEMKFVEVKAGQGGLRPNQHEAIRLLRSFAIPVEVRLIEGSGYVPHPRQKREPAIMTKMYPSTKAKFYELSGLPPTVSFPIVCERIAEMLEEFIREAELAGRPIEAYDGVPP